MEEQTITVYQFKEIMSADSVLAMIIELKSKLEKDGAILKQNNTRANLITYKKNEFIFNWLVSDYYNIRSCCSKIDEKDISNGWFVWLKDSRIITGIPFKTLDEENTYIYEKYFDHFFKTLYGQNQFLEEAIYCFKKEKYHACACLLFTVIENYERQISNFDPTKKFVMSVELKNTQTANISCFNEKYYREFEEKMNSFLRNNYYATSTASDPEPNVINRNRVMHGILTRRINKTDCLKMFVLLKSMYCFNEWLSCYRNMAEISTFLDSAK